MLPQVAIVKVVMDAFVSPRNNDTKDSRQLRSSILSHNFVEWESKILINKHFFPLSNALSAQRSALNENIHHLSYKATLLRWDLICYSMNTPFNCTNKRATQMYERQYIIPSHVNHFKCFPENIYIHFNKYFVRNLFVWSHEIHNTHTHMMRDNDVVNNNVQTKSLSFYPRSRHKSENQQINGDKIKWQPISWNKMYLFLWLLLPLNRTSHITHRHPHRDECIFLSLQCDCSIFVLVKTLVLGIEVCINVSGVNVLFISKRNNAPLPHTFATDFYLLFQLRANENEKNNIMKS